MVLSLLGREADGVGAVVPGLRHITGLAVTPDNRRLGIGRQLLATALDAARADGCCRVTLWTHRANKPAQRLLQSAGFRPTGRVESDPAGAEMTLLEASLVSRAD
jgi:ribosomal protein S18 acetylase RimI-like enzyme